MIKVKDYKAFHGIMKITPKGMIVPEFELEADWLYKPESDCWCNNETEFDSAICIVVSDFTDKQEPKKLKMIRPGIGICSCGSLIEKPKLRKPRQFCKWCGQAIDWEM